MASAPSSPRVITPSVGACANLHVLTSAASLAPPSVALPGPPCPRSEDRLGGVGTLCEANTSKGDLPSKPMVRLTHHTEPSRSKAPRVNGSKNPLTHCFRRARG